MILRTWRKPATITMTVTVACVEHHKPLVGFSDEVEKAWRSLMRKHRLKMRDHAQLCKVASSTQVLEAIKKEQEPPPVKGIVKSNTASDIGRVMLKFRQMEKDEIAGKKDDVYSKGYVPKKFAKGSAEYGTPKPGTLTEIRAKKASKHIAREMLYLCEVIREYGNQAKVGEGKVQISFGSLFQIYQFISDKVVGMLLRARKHKMVDFEGEMLYQRRDDDVMITLLLTEEEIKFAIDDQK